jgi:hypothetical protein
MQLERVAPEGLATERVVAKYLSALVEHCLRVASDLSIESVRCGGSSEGGHHAKKSSCGNRREYQDVRLAPSILLQSRTDNAFRLHACPPVALPDGNSDLKL